MSRNIILKPGSLIPYSYTSLGLEVPIGSDDARDFEIDYGVIDRLQYRPAKDVADFLSKHGIQRDGQQLNTAAIKEKFADDLRMYNEQNYPLTILTVVCPPYHKFKLHSRHNVGLFGSIEDEPIDFNFMFNYKILLSVMAFISDELKRLAGVEIENKFIVSDWAYRDVPGILTSLKNLDAIKSQMDLFKTSCQHFADSHLTRSKIQVLGYQDVGLDDALPLAMPMTVEEKEGFMLNVCSRSFPGLRDIDSILMAALIEYYLNDNGQGLYRACDSTGLWPEIEYVLIDFFESISTLDKKYAKSFVIDFLRLMRNTRDGRQGEGVDNGLIKASFYDAMVKAYEYLVIGSVLHNGFPTSWNFSWDTKFPASGLFYSKSQLDTFYIDPRSVPMSLPALKSRLNPF